MKVKLQKEREEMDKKIKAAQPAKKSMDIKRKSLEYSSQANSSKVS